MSKSSEKDCSVPCEPNLVTTSKTDILVGENLSICKSGTFDAEFDLLESTLSELKDGEHESPSSKPNCNDLIIVPHSETTKSSNNNSNNSNPQPNPEFLKAASKSTSECSLCQDTYNNRPDCVHIYPLQTTQHSKSIYNQGDTVIIQTNSEAVFSHSGDTQSEIANSCSIEAVNKTVLFVDFDQTSNTIDTKECDRQPSLSLKSFEVISRNPNCSGSLGFRRKELSQAIKHSDKGCDFDTDDNKTPIDLSNNLEESNLENLQNLHETLNTVNNSEYSTNISITMGDAEVASVNTPCHPDGSIKDLTTMVNSESNGSKFDSEVPVPVPLSEDQRDNDEYENPAESKEEECFKSLESEKVTPKKQICSSGVKVQSQVCNEDLNDEPSKKQGIYFSTPTVTRKLQDLNNQSSAAPDFGLVSPLDVKCLKGKQNLKRKYIGLQPIEEVDEDTDTNTEKKIKVDEDMDIVVNLVAPSKAGSSSTLPCYEAPAKSLLKKWQPSCLSRNGSATSFIVLDECGETEFDECPKLSQEQDSSRVDDFEIACQSLTEELMKSSSNIETLEKYHSQVQLENQMDDEKFDEILKELTMNVDLDDKTCLSLRSMDESTIDVFDKTCHTLKDMEESVDTSLSGTENKGKVDNESSSSEMNTTVIGGNNHISTSDDLSMGDNKDDIKKIELIAESQKVTNDNAPLELKSIKDEPRTSDEEALDVDEEDFLLEENNTKDKPYEFFEFVSTDPKENEDNYNPEWQKLGRLTSDEERYKAVRDRWRSLVPPDPNRNLTYRQWRARNNKPPITLSPLNNNHQLMNDNEKNQLCTAVFDNKIKKIVQELEDSRMNIYRERNRQFEELGRVQDDEQMRAGMRGFNYREMVLLHSNHLNQCRTVKTQYDQELKRIQDITEEKIRILREASEEVLLFQKFYKGVGARDDNDLYMTDIQVQELMETEEMLEQYRVFYK